MITNEQKRIIKNILSPFEPNKIGIFGSVARGEENEQSDIDILVNFRKKYSLFDLIGMKLHLEEALNRKVDLVTERALHPALKVYVEKDLIMIE